MACLYRRARSPFFWMEYFDAAGARRQESTELRAEITAEARQARTLCDEMTARERERGKGATGIERGEIWNAWVPRFLDQRYGAAEQSAKRSLGAWRNLAQFLSERGLATPRQVTRQEVRDFVAWRQEGKRARGVRPAAKNTALLEIKFFAIIMHEAVESGFATANPCLKLGLRREKPEVKPKISAQEHARILKALQSEPEWMRISYTIAWHQGCRFSETCFPLAEVDFARNVIGLRTKGHKESVAEVPLNPALRPLLQRLRRDGREMTFELPTETSRTWWRFFQKKVRLPHLCFHCTRVTFISRCHEAGIPEADVMRMVLHASETVHRIYPRVSSAGDRLQGLMRSLPAAE